MSIMELEKDPVDYHERLKDASKLLSEINGVGQNNLPKCLEPYKAALQTLSKKKDPEGFFLFDKIDKNLLLKGLRKKDLEKLTKEFANNPCRTLNILEFMNIFLTTAAKKNDDQLSMLTMVVGLVDLFTEIVRKKNKPFVTWEDISSAFLNSFVEENHGSEFGVANKYVYKAESLKRAVSPRLLSTVLNCFGICVAPA